MNNNSIGRLSKPRLQMNHPVLTEIAEKACMELIEACKANDYGNARERLRVVCANVQLQDFMETVITDMYAACGMIDIFVQTGLDCSPEGSPTRATYLAIAEYAFANKTSRDEIIFRNAFKHCLPWLSPVGYTRDGDLLFSMKHLARAIGIEADKIQDGAVSVVKESKRPSRLA